MTRHQNPIDAELDALERALNGEPGADPVLSELIREVRADAPTFDGPARESLDARVDAGFPRDPRPQPFLARFAPSGPLFRPALSIAAVAVLGLAVATAALNSGSDSANDVSSSVAAMPAADSAEPAPAQSESTAGGATAYDALSDEVPAGSDPVVSGLSTGSAPPDVRALQRQARALTAGTSVPAPPTGTGSNPGTIAGKRRVERSAELSLTTKPDDVQGVADDVIRTVQGLGGIVASSRIATAPDGGEATFDLRLPTSRLDPAIGQLSKLASVAGLTQDSQDITGSFVSAGDRLQDARDERKALLKALGRATTDRQVSSLRARIADSRRRIANAQADLARLKNRTDRATVALTITGDPSAADEKDEDEGGAWTPGDALGDAGRVLEVAAGVAVVAAAALVPLALLALLAYATARIARRRARERTLDATA